jgi:hypothetical protein
LVAHTATSAAKRSLQGYRTDAHGELYLTVGVALNPPHGWTCLPDTSHSKCTILLAGWLAGWLSFSQIATPKQPQKSHFTLLEGLADVFRKENTDNVSKTGGPTQN